MRRRGLLLALAAGVAGCELAVDTGGLSGGAVDSGADATAPRVDATTDAPAADAPAVSDVLDAALGPEAEAAPDTAAPCAITLVQADHANTTQVASSTITVASSSPERAHDTLVLGINYLDCGGVQAVADTSGNMYTRVIAPEANAGAGTVETWMASDIVDQPSNTVTVTFTSSCSVKNVKLLEYSGPTIGLADTTSSQGTGTAPDASLTAAARDMLVAHSGDEGTADAPGSGWTLIFKDEFGTIAQQMVADHDGAQGVSYTPGSGERWVLQGLALHCR
jgi:hypothetical protein